MYRNEPPLIVPGASPIETVFVTERYGIDCECIETCYPILNLCNDKCKVMPDLPECSQCQRLPAAQPTPIIIETAPYVPRPPSFERPAEPLISYPHPPLFPKPNPSNLPPKPIIPEIPRPPKFEDLGLVPPTPMLPEILQPPEVGILQPNLSSLPDLPDLTIVHEAPQLQDFDAEIGDFKPVPLNELPPKVVLPNIPRPPKLEPQPPMQPIIPDVPEVVTVLPILPEIALPSPPDSLPPLELLPISEFPMPPDGHIYFEHQLLEPQTIFHVPSHLEYEDLKEEFLIPGVSYVGVFESPQPPVIQPIYSDIVYPELVEIPNPVSPEQTILVTENLLHPETVLYMPDIQPIYGSEEAVIIVDKGILQPPAISDYQHICNDDCLLQRNISECEICLKTGVPDDQLELCTKCLVNPSEPDCELCYPILLNLCREFCIFEENEADCSSCYPQQFIEVPEINAPMEYIPILSPDVCPEHCLLTPMSLECARCGMGVEVVEKVCVDICAGYCLDNPSDEQCTVCYTSGIENVDVKIEEQPKFEVINYQCCYGDYCTPMPRNGICPVVCKEPCTTECSNDCFNPTCPDCQEIIALNEFRRSQFMIWLKSKLSDMKSRYMEMIEACIRRTELMYERELQAIEMEVDTSLLLA